MITERSVEVPWLQGQLESLTPKTLLDVGSAEALYHWDLIATGATVTFHDVRQFTPSLHPAMLHDHHVVVSPVPFPFSWSNMFDVVVCLSTLDHVGLPAYGQLYDPDALPLLAAELARITKPHGSLLLTVPVGIHSHAHPHQYLFTRAELLALFPYDRWAWKLTNLFRLHGQTYRSVASWPHVASAVYLKDRAEAVACLHLERL